MEDVGKDIEKWIRQVVAKTHKASGATICPFAKRTLEDGKIQIVPAKVDVLAQVAHCCDLFHSLNLDVVVIYFNYKITERKLERLCEQAGHLSPNFALMYDHPDNDGLHKGVSFSFGKAPLLMIQEMGKLKKAQQTLNKSGWYAAWDIKDYDQFH